MEKIKDKVIEIVSNEYEVLNRIYFVLVREGYKHARGDVFYIPFGSGLEIQYKLDISDLSYGCNVIVTEKILENLDLDKEKVIDIAYTNTYTKHPYLFESFDEILPALPIPVDIDIPMFVLTNTSKTFGAGTILYPGMKEKLESILGDFIVIPSSVHETIIFPDFGNNEGIANIIKEINATVVAEEEVLADVPFKLLGDKNLIAV